MTLRNKQHRGIVAILCRVIHSLAQVDRLCENCTHNVIDSKITALLNVNLILLQACKFIEENLSMRVENLGKEALINCAKTAMSSKIVGAESDFFSQLVVDAVTSVKTEPRGKRLSATHPPSLTPSNKMLSTVLHGPICQETSWQ